MFPLSSVDDTKHTQTCIH